MTVALIFGFGLVIAATDGAWFPWANVAGVGLMALAAFIVNRGGAR
jgi:hypothetical protein